MARMPVLRWGRDVRPGNRPVYTLLAWDGHNSLTNRKWVESVTMNGGRAKFGLPNILMPEGFASGFAC